MEKIASHEKKCNKDFTFDVLPIDACNIHRELDKLQKAWKGNYDKVEIVTCPNDRDFFSKTFKVSFTGVPKKYIELLISDMKRVENTSSF